MKPVLLTIAGEVERPMQLTFDDLAAIDARHQVVDVSQIDPHRAGDAVRLSGLLELVAARTTAEWIDLHASRDDFHASIPLGAVRERALIIYRLHGAPLPLTSGGPVRFFIPDFAACHTQEIDECANVKFVDQINLSATKGFDNRPHDGTEHEELHRKQDG